LDFHVTGVQTLCSSDLYDLPYLQQIHRILFDDVYEWAGELRTVDISKGGTHFCNVTRIEAEAAKLFRRMATANWFEGLARQQLKIGRASWRGAEGRRW